MKYIQKYKIIRKMKNIRICFESCNLEKFKLKSNRQSETTKINHLNHFES